MGQCIIRGGGNVDAASNGYSTGKLLYPGRDYFSSPYNVSKVVTLGFRPKCVYVYSREGDSTNTRWSKAAIAGETSSVNLDYFCTLTFTDNGFILSRYIDGGSVSQLNIVWTAIA